MNKKTLSSARGKDFGFAHRPSLSRFLSPRRLPFRLFFRFLLPIAYCLLPIFASAQNMLIVTDTGGTNTKFAVTDAGFVGAGMAAPLYNYDLSGQGVSKSSMHFSMNGTDVGGWITSVGDTNFFFSSGVEYDASLGGWIQKSSSGVGVVIGGDAPGLTIYTASGTTVGALAPMGAGARMRITPDGKVGIGTKTPTQLLDINSNGMRIEQPNTPASSSTACNQGDMSWDANFVYVCVATNTWKRAALSSW